jgi:AraC-like DNA-binding protein
MRAKMEAESGKIKGILNPKEGEKKFTLLRYLPSPDLRFFVQRYWIIRWNLPEPYVQEELPYPCVNLGIERGKTGIYGVVTKKADYRLEGKGLVFGVKFRPGAFYPFLKAPVSTINDSYLSLEESLGVDTTKLEDAILSREDDAEMISIMENILRVRLPEEDENVIEVNRIVDYIIAHRDITKVDDVVRRLNINKRTLQRLFSQYVGVSPKWVIKQYRLHEAADQLADGEAVNSVKVALSLGYFDQAHFIKDFKLNVGSTPVKYARTGEMSN